MVNLGSVTLVLGGLTLVLTSWMGREPNSNLVLSFLWVLAILLLLVGVKYGLQRYRTNSGLGRVGLGTITIALLLLFVGGLGMMANGVFGTSVLYVVGVLFLPVGLIFFGLDLWSSAKLKSLAIVVFMTGIIAGPVAVIAEALGTFPSLGWSIWALSIGMGFALMGTMLHRRSFNRPQFS